MKRVIDGDTLKCLEEFEESETQEILEKYRNKGLWDEVEVDGDGDIILFEEI